MLGGLRELQFEQRAPKLLHVLEKVLGVRGEEVLYVGDHIFTDVNMAKKGTKG